MQKFARGVLHNNVGSTVAPALPRSPSVAGLQLALGNGAMSNSISDIENSKCLLVFGYNCAADSHPIVARRVIKARENEKPKNHRLRPALYRNRAYRRSLSAAQQRQQYGAGQRLRPRPAGRDLYNHDCAGPFYRGAGRLSRNGKRLFT